MQSTSAITHIEEANGSCSDCSLVVCVKPKLLDRLREALRSRHYSRRTEQTYVMWVKRFIFFHNMRHPAEMAEPEIR